MRKKPQTILWEESDKYKRGCASDIPAQWHNIAINSMEVFAEEEAIAFAEYMIKYGWHRNDSASADHWFAQYQSPKTTKQLYEHFKSKG